MENAAWRKWKITALCVLAGGIFVLAEGCGNGVWTEEEIVIPREEKMTEGDAGEAEEQVLSGNEGIAGQVQAPERYIWEGGAGNVRVKVDAPVVVPEAEGFKTYKVTGRVFTQEDYDRVNQVLLEGVPLWDRDYGKIEETEGKTRQEIEETIQKLVIEKEKETAGEYVKGSRTEKEYEKLIEKYLDMLDAAPWGDAVVEAQINISYEENAQDPDANYWSGNATLNGQDYQVEVNNDLREEQKWRWVNFNVRRSQYNSALLWADGSEPAVQAGISGEEARAMAKADAEKMFFTDFMAVGEEYSWSFPWNEKSDGLNLENRCNCYCVHMMRTMDGIPVTYTYNNGSSFDESDAVLWPYETVDIIYDEEGLVYFNWTNPYQVEKLSDEYVFLIPFSDIQSVFEEMMLKKYSDFFEDAEANAEFEIKEVRLGYMRIREKGDFTEGKMVPVWDFFGSETIYYGELEEPYEEDGPYRSWLTVNAMDGTIIDRGFGY